MYSSSIRWTTRRSRTIVCPVFCARCASFIRGTTRPPRKAIFSVSIENKVSWFRGATTPPMGIACPACFKQSGFVNLTQPQSAIARTFPLDVLVAQDVDGVVQVAVLQRVRPYTDSISVVDSVPVSSTSTVVGREAAELPCMETVDPCCICGIRRGGFGGVWLCPSVRTAISRAWS